MSIVGFVLVTFGILLLWSGYKRISAIAVLQSLVSPAAPKPKTA